MRVAMPDWTSLALFAATVLAVALYGLAVSGHFPAEDRRSTLKDGIGGAILWGTIAIAILAGATAIYLGLARIPGYAAVIAGGLAVLGAPLLLSAFPDRFVDGRRGLLALAGLAALLAGATALATTG